MIDPKTKMADAEDIISLVNNNEVLMKMLHHINDFSPIKDIYACPYVGGFKRDGSDCIVSRVVVVGDNILWQSLPKLMAEVDSSYSIDDNSEDYGFTLGYNTLKGMRAYGGYIKITEGVQL